MSLTRRHVLAGLAASLPAAGAAATLRPRLRPAGLGQPPGPEAILSRYGLAGETGFVLRDLETGRIVEQHRPDALLPPASVTKVITTLYGLEALGPDYRFRTSVRIDGPIVDGQVQGDLYLVGGGDPNLDTDGLADLAEQIAGSGIRGVTGRAWVVADALPYQPSIDPGQPVHVGYNPAISGLNLNFNRVHFKWEPEGKGYSVAMTARGTRWAPAANMTRMQIVERGAPVFAYSAEAGRDHWSVSRRALGKGGARWLPVRAPALYAADVFRTVAAEFDVTLPVIARAAAEPAGLVEVASVQSAPFASMAKAMLKYSTNLTAEVAGLRAHQMLGGAPGRIADSAAAMTSWLHRSHGLRRAGFHSHSGLTDKTLISAEEMVQVLDIAATGQMPALLGDIPLRDEDGRSEVFGNSRVQAKTGTLDFTAALAGYLHGQNGRRYAFAILSADMEARRKVPDGVERPAGSRRRIGAARVQERQLLARWARLYGM